MDLMAWIAARGGVAHRRDALRRGASDGTIRRAILDGSVRVVRRQWLVQADATAELVLAASRGARLACLSVALIRGWWIPDGVSIKPHLSLPPHATDRSRADDGCVRHWDEPLTPFGAYDLVEPSIDALRHVAMCLPMDDALAVWESAIRQEELDPASLALIPWKNTRAAQLAAECTGLPDSGLETRFVTRIRRRGVQVVQQAWIAGRPVDGLIGEWLVVQLDGQEHHAAAPERARDAALDAELTLRGYTVLRFTYAQVIHHWPATERTVLRAMAAGLHLRPRRAA